MNYCKFCEKKVEKVENRLDGLPVCSQCWGKYQAIRKTGTEHDDACLLLFSILEAEAGELFCGDPESSLGGGYDDSWSGINQEEIYKVNISYSPFVITFHCGDEAIRESIVKIFSYPHLISTVRGEEIIIKQKEE